MKSRIIAGLLAFFLGGIGAHYFYRGKIGKGILALLLCWTGIPEVIGIIQALIYWFTESDEVFTAQYCD